MYLEDRTQKPWCSFGTPPEDYLPAYEGDVPCPLPCYPCVQVSRHSEGGTYVWGGTTSAEINITYNYSKYFSGLGPDGLHSLSGLQAGDTVSRLERVVAQLGTATDDDYWKATPGNAGFVLSVLLEWARQHPDGTWRVS